MQKSTASYLERQCGYAWSDERATSERKMNQLSLVAHQTHKLPLQVPLLCSLILEGLFASHPRCLPARHLPVSGTTGVLRSDCKEDPALWRLNELFSVSTPLIFRRTFWNVRWSIERGGLDKAGTSQMIFFTTTGSSMSIARECKPYQPLNPITVLKELTPLYRHPSPLNVVRSNLIKGYRHIRSARVEDRFILPKLTCLSK